MSALPWVVGLGTVLALLPLAWVTWVAEVGTELVFGDMPVFLLVLALSLWARAQAREGQAPSRFLLGAILGAFLPCLTVMLGIGLFATQDPFALGLYMWTPPLLLALGFWGALAGMGLGWIVRLFTRTGARSPG
jgi:hypothetical protein